MNPPVSNKPKPFFVSFDAPFGGYVGRAFGIAFLNLLSIGLYKPYGLTRTRRALYGHVRVGADALAYSGNARDLGRVTFYPSLALLFLLFVPAVLQFEVPLLWAGIIGVVQTLLLVMFYQFLFFRQRAYELANISWRGESLSLEGSAWAYMWDSFLTQLASLFSLGLLAGWRRTRLARRIYDNLWYGRQRVSCDLTMQRLWLVYLPGWLLSLAGFSYAVFYCYQQAWLPLLNLYHGGAPDPAMAAGISLDGGMGGMGGAPDTESLAQIGTVMHAVVAVSLAWPGWVVWRKFCFAPFEHLWWRELADSLRCGNLRLRYEGGMVPLFLIDAISFIVNFTTANLTRPFTTYARLRHFCNRCVLVAK